MEEFEEEQRPQNWKKREAQKMILMILANGFVAMMIFKHGLVGTGGWGAIYDPVWI